MFAGGSCYDGERRAKALEAEGSKFGNGEEDGCGEEDEEPSPLNRDKD
jgi:hypothetical protein